LHLDSRQERVLAGEEGEARQFAMEIVTKVGDAVDADSLVPIKSAHVLAHFSSLHMAGIELLERFAEKGGRFGVPTTVDPASIDLQDWRSFGIDEEYAGNQFRLCAAYAKLGGIQCWTCVQYQVCNFPKAGETVSWAESSSVVFANSVIGCRSNKITSGMDIASAILGLTPKFGMLEDQNRAAGVSFRAAFGEFSDLDFRSLGYFIGKKSGFRVPALEGLPGNVTSDEVKHLGAAAAAAGQVTMIHLPGITPGSPTLQSAVRGERVETIDVTRKDLQEIEGDLNQTDATPDLVALGVPHLSPAELGLIAKLLGGKKLKKGVRLFAYTSSQAYDLAGRTGILDDMLAAGARVTQSTDAEISPLKKMGFDTVMTNSAKLAEIVSSEGEVELRYAPLRSILEEVTYDR
jgi:predicted aconitase